MSPKEVDEVFSLADVNKDGKLDYAEVQSPSISQQYMFWLKKGGL